MQDWSLLPKKTQKSILRAQSRSAREKALSEKKAERESKAAERAAVKAAKARYKELTTGLYQAQLEDARRDKENVRKSQAADAEIILNYWRGIFSREDSIWTTARHTKVCEALAKFGLEKCKLVLRIAALDPNTRGENKLNRPFDDLVNIFRNEERVEMYLRMRNLTDRRASNLIPLDTAVRSEWQQ